MAPMSQTISSPQEHEANRGRERIQSTQQDTYAYIEEDPQPHQQDYRLRKSSSFGFMDSISLSADEMGELLVSPIKQKSRPNIVTPESVTAKKKPKNDKDYFYSKWDLGIRHQSPMKRDNSSQSRNWQSPSSNAATETTFSSNSYSATTFSESNYQLAIPSLYLLGSPMETIYALLRRWMSNLSHVFSFSFIRATFLPDDNPMALLELFGDLHTQRVAGASRLLRRMELILSKNPKSVHSKDAFGNTPLHLACVNPIIACNEKAIQMLIVASDITEQIGTEVIDDVKACDFRRQLKITQQKTITAAAASSSSAPSTAQVLREQTFLGENPLHTACKNGFATYEVIETLLRNNPTCVCIPDRIHGNLPIHNLCILASKTSKPDSVEATLLGAVMLLEQQWPESIKQPNLDGNLPIHLALQHIITTDCEVVSSSVIKTPPKTEKTPKTIMESVESLDLSDIFGDDKVKNQKEQSDDSVGDTESKGSQVEGSSPSSPRRPRRGRRPCRLDKDQQERRERQQSLQVQVVQFLLSCWPESLWMENNFGITPLDYVQSNRSSENDSPILDLVKNVEDRCGRSPMIMPPGLVAKGLSSRHLVQNDSMESSESDLNVDDSLLSLHEEAGNETTVVKAGRNNFNQPANVNWGNESQANKIRIPRHKSWEDSIVMLAHATTPRRRPWNKDEECRTSNNRSWTQKHQWDRKSSEIKSNDDLSCEPSGFDDDNAKLYYEMDSDEEGIINEKAVASLTREDACKSLADFTEPAQHGGQQEFVAPVLKNLRSRSYYTKSILRDSFNSNDSVDVFDSTIDKYLEARAQRERTKTHSSSESAYLFSNWHGADYDDFMFDSFDK